MRLPPPPPPKPRTPLTPCCCRYLSPFLTSSNQSASSSSSPIFSTIELYLKCRELAVSQLVDGGGQKPRYTLRTLCRGLSASCTLLSVNKLSLPRAIYEGFQ